MQKQNEKSEKVKAILKKSLDVFCYIVTALAVTLGIAMGVNSCSGSNEPQRIDPQQVETSKSLRGSLTNPDYDNYSVYENRYTAGDYVQDFDYLRPLNDVPTTTSAVQRNEIGLGFRLPVTAYILSSAIDSNYVPINYIRYYFRDYKVDDVNNVYEYKFYQAALYSTELITGNSNGIVLMYKVGTLANSDIYHFSNVRIAISEGSLDDFDKFLWFFKKAYNQDFTFNVSFNYNAPSSLQYNAVYMDQMDDTFWTWGGQEQGVAYKDYEMGWFSSNGKLFNKIRWYCSAGSGVSVMIDNQIVQLEYAGNWVYTMMYYVNTWSNEAVIVNTRDSVPYNAGNNRYYANSSTWQIPAYRVIRLLQTPTQDTIDLLGSFNNNNAYDIGGLSVGGTFADVFTLVGSAFTGLLPILTTQILPYVTIGTLLFVPLVAILVFAIIRIIKK